MMQFLQINDDKGQIKELINVGAFARIVSLHEQHVVLFFYRGGNNITSPDMAREGMDADQIVQQLQGAS